MFKDDAFFKFLHPNTQSMHYVGLHIASNVINETDATLYVTKTLLQHIIKVLYT